MASNGTNQTAQHLGSFEPMYGYVFAGLYIIVIIIAIFGNLLVCCSIALSPKLRRSPTKLFILSLGISDLITASAAMPFDADILITSGLWNHGGAVCKAWTVAYLLTVPTSILTLLALSVDRYKTLSDPLNRFRRSRFMTRKRAIIAIIVIWMYCFTIAIIPVAEVINQLPFMYRNKCYFPMPPLFNVVSTMVNFVLPILATCYIYLKIYQIAKLQPLQQQKFSAWPCGRQQKDYLRNIRAAKTISMFVCAFMFCWIPWSTISIITNVCSDEFFYAIPPHIYPPLLMLGYMNSALNPFLFSFRNRAFRSTYLRFFNALRRRQPSQGISRSIHSTKRSEVPDTESGTMVQMFSIRSLAPNDEPSRYDGNGSKEPLNNTEKSMNWSFQIDIDFTTSYKTDNTYF